MKVERYYCDCEGCTAKSNGDVGSWYGVRTEEDEQRRNAVVIVVLRMTETGKDAGNWLHACGEPCALKLAAKAMRELPR